MKQGWKQTTLGELVAVNPEQLGSGTPDNYAFYYIDLSAVNNKVIEYPQHKIIFKDASPRARRRTKAGDILLSTVRPNLKGFGRIEIDSSDLVCSTGFAVLRCSQEETADYIYQYIFSDHVHQQIDALVVGSNYPAITNDDVKNLEIIIPESLPEQRKIAAVLRTWDEGAEKIRKQIEIKQKRKRYLMNVLLSGDSSPKNKSESKWENLVIGDILKLGSGATKPTDFSENFNDEHSYPVYGGNGVMGYSGYYNADGKNLIIGRVGEYCGCVHYYEGKCWITDNALHARDIRQDVDIPFFYHCLVSQNLSRLRNKGGQPLVSQQPIYDKKILLPSLTEQRKITTILTTADSEISSLQKQEVLFQSQKRGLMQQLLSGQVRVKGEE
jgi:type I restriction enzyme, S subunit